MIKTNQFEKELFPIPFIDLFPTICDKCGSETEVSEALTLLQCSNRKCPSKIEYRIFELFQDIGIDDITIEDCRGFVERFNILNPYAVFLYNPKFDGLFHLKYNKMKSENLYKRINQRRGMLLWEFIKIGNFMNLKDSAEKLFSNYTDIDLFYKDLEEGGIQFIQDILLEGNELQNDKSRIYVKAVTLYETLLFFKEDILKGIKGVVVLKPKKEIGVVFGCKVTGYLNNYSFILDLNRKYNGKVYFYITNILSGENLKLVYWEEPINKRETTKIQKVKSEYPDIKIVDITNIDCVIGEIIGYEG